MPRLLRDSPLNGIWEGSGNVMSLDVLRAMAREPDGLPAFLAECELARGADARLDAHLDALPATLGALAGEDAQWLARRAVEDLALAFQASLLVRTAPPAVADAFCAGRLGEARGRAYGTLPGGRRRRRACSRGRWRVVTPSALPSDRGLADRGDRPPEQVARRCRASVDDRRVGGVRVRRGRTGGRASAHGVPPCEFATRPAAALRRSSRSALPAPQ